MNTRKQLEVETKKAKPKFSSKSLLFLWLTMHFFFRTQLGIRMKPWQDKGEKNKTSQVIYLNASFHIVTVFKNK